MPVRKTKYAKFLILTSKSINGNIQSWKVQFEKKISGNVLSILYHFTFSCTLDSILGNNTGVRKNLFKVQ